MKRKRVWVTCLLAIAVGAAQRGSPVLVSTAAVAAVVVAVVAAVAWQRFGRRARVSTATA